MQGNTVKWREYIGKTIGQGLIPLLLFLNPSDGTYAAYQRWSPRWPRYYSLSLCTAPSSLHHIVTELQEKSQLNTSSQPTMSDDRIAQYREAFDIFDANGDGLIDVKVFKLKALFLRVTRNCILGPCSCSHLPWLQSDRVSTCGDVQWGSR